MIENTVKKLIIYAKRHLFLQESDLVYAENMVLGYLGCLTPSNEPGRNIGSQNGRIARRSIIAIPLTT